MVNFDATTRRVDSVDSRSAQVLSKHPLAERRDFADALQEGGPLAAVAQLVGARLPGCFVRCASDPVNRVRLRSEF